MSLNPHIYRLTQLHRRLDEAMRHERRRGGESLRLLRLRTLRLVVKARLAALMRRPAFQA